MKRLLRGFFGFSLLLVYGCTASNAVVSNHFIQKRKYRSGWHIELLSNKTKDDKQVAQEQGFQEKTGELEIQAEKRWEMAEQFQVYGELNPLQNNQLDNAAYSPKKTFKNFKTKDLDQITSVHNDAPTDGIAPEEPEDDTHVMVVVSFGLMLLTISLGIIPVLGFLLSVAALVTAIIGLKNSKTKAFGILAFALSLILVLLSVGYNIFIFSAFLLL